MDKICYTALTISLWLGK